MQIFKQHRKKCMQRRIGAQCFALQAAANLALAGNGQIAWEACRPGLSCYAVFSTATIRENRVLETPPEPQVEPFASRRRRNGAESEGPKLL